MDGFGECLTGELAGEANADEVLLGDLSSTESPRMFVSILIGSMSGVVESFPLAGEWGGTADLAGDCGATLAGDGGALTGTLLMCFKQKGLLPSITNPSSLRLQFRLFNLFNFKFQGGGLSRKKVFQK